MSPTRHVTEDSSSPLPDAELVRLCVEEGCPDSFEHLMTRYHGRVYSVIMRLVQDRERASDLTQEAFLKAWRGLARFEGGSSFFTWIYRIARNLVASHYRRERSRPRVVIGVDEDRGDDDATGVSVPDERFEPESRAQERELRQGLMNALEELGPDFREIIVLKDIQGMAYEEISDLLEIPVGTVRSRLHRARLELKAKMRPLLGE
ncbi:MAG: sigma-70 family RNA polymerase sigma factor [Planctomycetes bacterium]|nr:sigma-70 family RNA polymerase sigma factor [Planctomycetota bacterium]